MNDMHRHPIVSDADRVKGLLDGTVDPSQLEDDPELYSMAERIYGREALDEMGISPPEVPIAAFDESDYTNGNNLEVELPDEPEIIDSVPPPIMKRSRLPFFAGIIGLAIVSFNMMIGIGAILDLCEEPPTDLPLEFNSQANMQGNALHVTWTVTNLEPSAEYSVEWSISENGSSNVVDSDWFNWSAQTTYIHSESRPIQELPWCYISTLYENQTEVANSNDCGEVQTFTIMSLNEVSFTCDDNPRLIWSKISDYESIESWAPEGSGDLIDGSLLMLFGIIALTGLLRRKSR